MVILFRSCEAIKTKAAELKEFCHAKSFNIQPLIPTIKVKYCYMYITVIIKLRYS